MTEAPAVTAWIEPIRTAAVAVAADPPPLTEWEVGEEGEGEIVDHEVEHLLQELGWPSRTRTSTTEFTVFGSNPHRTQSGECTETYFPASWLAALDERIAEYVRARDADQDPTVPDRLRLRNLPASTSFEALRDLVEAAWDDAWDELACSVAVMCPDEAMGMDGLRLNLATYLWYGPAAFAADPEPAEPVAGADAPTFEERLRQKVGQGCMAKLQGLPSPKWRAWFIDTWNDRVAIHDILERCGVEAPEHLGASLCAARYAVDMDTDRMTIEELVNRVEARHRLLVAAVRSLRGNAIGDGSERRDWPTLTEHLKT